MPSGNFDEPTAAPPAPTPAARRPFRLPSEYYAAPLAEVRPIFPKWAPYGCGAASAVFLVLLFAAGSLMSGERFGSLLDFVLGTSLGELRPMMQSEISAEDKAEFEAAVNAMRDGLRNGTIKVARVQPFLKEMQSAIGDSKVTEKELEALTKVARDAAKPPKPGV